MQLRDELVIDHFQVGVIKGLSPDQVWVDFGHEKRWIYRKYLKRKCQGQWIVRYSNENT